MTPRYKEFFEDFVRKLEKRLETGHQEYGDNSFDRPTVDLIDEIEQELLDVSGWSVVLFTRLRRLREKVQASTVVK